NTTRPVSSVNCRRAAVSACSLPLYLSLRYRRSAVVPVLPERASRLHEENLDCSGSPPKRQNASALTTHDSTICPFRQFSRLVDACQSGSPSFVLGSGKCQEQDMTYNTIMVQLDVNNAATPRLTFALDLAKCFKADLIGFAAAEPHIFVPRDESGLVAAEMLRQRTEEIE